MLIVGKGNAIFGDIQRKVKIFGDFLIEPLGTKVMSFIEKAKRF